MLADLLFEGRTGVAVLVISVRKKLDREYVGVAVDDTPEQS
jgi:hypothetical protein